MKCLKSTLLRIILIAPLVLGTADVVAADGEAGDNSTVLSVGVRDTAPLIGAWSVSLTNTGTKASNPALYSFLPGGVLNQSENPMVDPMLGNLVFSNAHGAWEYDADKDSYLIRYFKLVFQADASYWGQEETTGTLSIDNEGALVGTISFGSEQAEFIGKRITATNKSKK